MPRALRGQGKVSGAFPLPPSSSGPGGALGNSFNCPVNFETLRPVLPVAGAYPAGGEEARHHVSVSNNRFCSRLEVNISYIRAHMFVHFRLHLRFYVVSISTKFMFQDT